VESPCIAVRSVAVAILVIVAVGKAVGMSIGLEVCVVGVVDRISTRTTYIS
jgi:hypothetical protein